MISSTFLALVGAGLGAGVGAGTRTMAEVQLPLLIDPTPGWRKHFCWANDTVYEAHSLLPMQEVQHAATSVVATDLIAGDVCMHDCVIGFPHVVGAATEPEAKSRSAAAADAILCAFSINGIIFIIRV